MPDDNSVVDHKLLMNQIKIMMTSALQPVEVESLYQDFLANGDSLVEWLASVGQMNEMLRIATTQAEDLPPERQ